MTPEQIKLVQESFGKVRPNAEQVADIFYNRLFEIAPQVRPLFPEDMKSQGRKLMSILATAVDNLDNLESIVPAVQDLGRRHVDYKVEAEHYDLVAQALLWTLEQGLGDDFTPDVKQAWTETYTILSTTMKEAAHGQKAA